MTNGTRHAFRHLGSGTFAGADTYLSEFFIVNPMIFAQEYKELQARGYEPVVYVDRRCRITTPYEMYLNQMLEESRGENRHGSCGMGIWETVKLYNTYIVRHFAYYNSPFDLIDERIDTYRCSIDMYVGSGEIISSVLTQWCSTLGNGLLDRIDQKYQEDMQFMIDHTTVCDADIIKAYDSIIFENGQGLLLNDDPNNVHTTPSNTGLDNIRILENKLGFQAEPIYVTRPYLTRHGADPNFVENHTLNQMFDGTDQTNVPNDFQGKIRYGNMDENFIERIKRDSFDRDFSVLITHANQYKIPDMMNDHLYGIKTLYSIGKERESIME